MISTANTDPPSASCCFTGHRFIAPGEIRRMKFTLMDEVSRLAQNGVTRFYAGGAIGFDMAAEMAVLNCASVDSRIKLTLALPHRAHTSRWKPSETAVFGRILELADEVVYISDRYTSSCMMERNRYMVDRSAYCICYLRLGAKGGGTLATVNYAVKCGLRIANMLEGERIITQKQQEIQI